MLSNESRIKPRSKKRTPFKIGRTSPKIPTVIKNKAMTIYRVRFADFMCMVSDYASIVESKTAVRAIHAC